ncbi:MAG: peptidylprolyl isomerase [Synechococcus sp. SB0673_bin_10]|nr:peptidylprolyl isomerase [Cyanobacteria bacterium MAG IRC1_bin_28]MXX08256.1 peptidylprolyl isomerase [Synechococcus sp. SB0667_bin_8]MXY62687.1 peptidylprolyl isomerase [Synechococcus sp. SB0665_bin_28]MYF21110.1 peptidylprolyl isomerase [Synechococcus sp. SB0677_bin_5]MYF35960.1 peptidylprolyl isomerase [Synechococcus sp. SB0678_bin_12]MYG64064.1 peptidylprolyl isomerase [Synechococcus sp. SB0675_bin_7]MYI71416.1 peptidylprolyl isomerase [Synechococcus sp. SB0673_bin_10]MYI87064.1 pepti
MRIFSSRDWARALGSTVLLAAIPLLLLASCTQAQNTMAQNIGCANSPVACLDGTATITISTSKGDFTVEVDGAAAPLTSGNFVDLVKRGTYDGTVFHRVIPGFVAQGGDPASADPKTPPDRFGTGGFVDPGTGQERRIPLEIALTGEEQPRYGKVLTEPGLRDRLKLRHEQGALAMARSQLPNSASAQFYVALEDLSQLDGSYAVFGRVIAGMEVVSRLEKGDRLVRAVVAGQP